MEKSKQEAKQEALSLKRKILTISNEIRLGKDGKNKFANYSYFTPDSINAELTPLLLKYGVFCHFNLEKNDKSYIARLEVSNADDNETIGYSIESPELEIRGANPVQSLGGLQTYLKRYLLMNVFNIADNKDDFDANEQNKKKENISKKETQVDEILKESINVLEEISNIKTTNELSNLYKVCSKDIQDTYKNEFTRRKQELLNQMIKDNGKH